MSFVVDIQTAFPKNYYSQERLIEELKVAWVDFPKALQRIDGIHNNVLVDGRHLALPVKDYFSFKSFTEKNDAFIKCALSVAECAVNKVLRENDLEPTDIDAIWSNTVTGMMIPSIEARLMNKINFRTNIKRVPLFGLGCMAGAAGINRVAEYLRSYPKEAVLFLSVELCSLTFQLDDISPANLVSTGLFGDGAAVVLMVGDEHPKAKGAPLHWKDSSSIFFKDTESVMGWDIGESGLKIVLNKNVAEVAKQNMPIPLQAFLERNDLELKNIDSFMAHPGGPKILEAMEGLFNLGEKGLNLSWESLREKGNMSSVSVLDIIKKTIEMRKNSEKIALSVAMGPGFSAEFGLFEWN